MAIRYEFTVKDGILHVTSTGVDDTLEDTRQYGEAILEEAKREDVARILCDERDLDYQLSTVDTFFLAEHYAKLYNGDAWVAIVTKPDNLDDLAFFEMVAVNRGMEIKAFRKMDAARRWLEDTFDPQESSRQTRRRDRGHPSRYA